MSRVDITTRVGLRKENLSLPGDTTLAGLLANPANKAVIGAPEGATVTVNAGAVSMDYVLRAGDEVIFEQQATDKA